MLRLMTYRHLNQSSLGDLPSPDKCADTVWHIQEVLQKAVDEGKLTGVQPLNITGRRDLRTEVALDRAMPRWRWNFPPAILRYIVSRYGDVDAAGSCPVGGPTHDQEIDTFGRPVPKVLKPLARSSAWLYVVLGLAAVGTLGLVTALRRRRP